MRSAGVAPADRIDFWCIPAALSPPSPYDESQHACRHESGNVLGACATMFRGGRGPRDMGDEEETAGHFSRRRIPWVEAGGDLRAEERGPASRFLSVFRTTRGTFQGSAPFGWLLWSQGNWPMTRGRGRRGARADGGDDGISRLAGQEVGQEA